MATSLCSSRHRALYVTTGNLSLPDAVQFNGIYRVVDAMTPEIELSDNVVVDQVTKKLYRHDQRPDLFAYYVTSGRSNYGDTEGRWEIGRAQRTSASKMKLPAARSAGSAVLTSSWIDGLTTATEPSELRWRLFRSVSGRKRRRVSIGVRVTCLDDDDVMSTCTSGVLSVSGLEARHTSSQGHRQGTYRLTSCTSQLRPVYRYELFLILTFCAINSVAAVILSLR